MVPDIIRRTALTGQPTTYKLQLTDAAQAALDLTGRVFSLVIKGTPYVYAATVADEGGVSTATMTVPGATNTALLAGKGQAEDYAVAIGETVDGAYEEIVTGKHMVRPGPDPELLPGEDGGGAGASVVFTGTLGGPFVVSQQGAAGRSAPQALYDAGLIDEPTTLAMDARYRAVGEEAAAAEAVLRDEAIATSATETLTTLRDGVDGSLDTLAKIVAFVVETSAAAVSGALTTIRGGVASALDTFGKLTGLLPVFPEAYGASQDAEDNYDALMAAIAAANTQRRPLSGRGRAYRVLSNMVLLATGYDTWRDITIIIAPTVPTPGARALITKPCAAPTLIGALSSSASAYATEIALATTTGLSVADHVLVVSDDNMTSYNKTLAKACELNRVRSIEGAAVGLFRRLKREALTTFNAKVYKPQTSAGLDWKRVQIIGQGATYNQRGLWCEYGWRNRFFECGTEGCEQAGIAEVVCLETQADNWRFIGPESAQRGYGVSHSGCHGAAYGNIWSRRNRHPITGSHAPSEYLGGVCGRPSSVGNITALEVSGSAFDMHPGVGPMICGDVFADYAMDADLSSPVIFSQGGGVKAGKVIAYGSTTGGVYNQSYGWRDPDFEPTVEVDALEGHSCDGSAVSSYNYTNRDGTYTPQKCRVIVHSASGYFLRGIVGLANQGDVEITVGPGRISASSRTVYGSSTAAGRVVLNLNGTRMVHRGATTTPITAQGGLYHAATGNYGVEINWRGGGYETPNKTVYNDDGVIRFYDVDEPTNPVDKAPVGSVGKIYRFRDNGSLGRYSADTTGFDLPGTSALRIGGRPVAKVPLTGYKTMAGTATLDASGLNTATVTLPQLAQVVKGLEDALLYHGGIRFTNAEVPVNTALPAITGTPAVGQVLSCSTGAWANTPTGYTYQWTRDGAAISGATASTYTLVSGDSGKQVACTVTASNIAGGASASSAAILVGAPNNTVAPAVTGDLFVGSTLTTTNGTWGGTPTGYTYKWFRNGSEITGATAATYVIQLDDDGALLNAQVTATNGVGSTAALSNLVGPAEAGWSLLDIETLAFWARPADAPLGVLNTPLVDRVGSKALTNATTNRRPTVSDGFNGRREMTFDGIRMDIYQDSTAGLPVGAEEGWLFAVVNQTALDTTTRQAFGYGGNTSGPVQRKLSRIGVPASQLRAENGTAGYAVQGFEFIGKHVVAARYVGDSKQVELWIDGREATAWGFTLNEFGLGIGQQPHNTGSTRVRIGATLSDSPSARWLGDIGDTVITGELSDDDRDRTFGYLHWYFGLEALLPDDHPWKLQPPWLVS